MRSAFYAGARALLGSVVALVAIALMPWSHHAKGSLMGTYSRGP